MIGALIRDTDVATTLDKIEQADALGVDAAWLTTTAANRDALTLMAAAAARTRRVKLGAAIVPTWPRHPVVVAQQAQVIEALAPGRLQIGVGPASSTSMERLVGAPWRTPLKHLTEYVTVLRTLLHDGNVDFDGDQVVCHARLAKPLDVPVLASALLPGAFRVCGEAADGAITWMAPWPYVEQIALPSMRAGAEAARRALPGLVYHVPVCVHPDRRAAVAACRQQLANYGRIDSWVAMFRKAGFDPTGGLDDAFFDAFLISGTSDEVTAGLRACLDRGATQVIADPILIGDPATSYAATLLAIAAA